MTLDSIRKICKSTGVLCVFRYKDGKISQWVGDGSALFPVDNVISLDMDDDAIRYLFGMEDKEKYFFKTSEAESIEKYITSTDKEEIAELSPIKITYRKETFCVFKASCGCIYIKDRYLKPFKKHIDDYSFFVRYNSTVPYVVVKYGFIDTAIIMPMSFAKDDKFQKEIQKIGILAPTK